MRAWEIYRSLDVVQCFWWLNSHPSDVAHQHIVLVCIYSTLSCECRSIGNMIILCIYIYIYIYIHRKKETTILDNRYWYVWPILYQSDSKKCNRALAPGCFIICHPDRPAQNWPWASFAGTFDAGGQRLMSWLGTWGCSWDDCSWHKMV